MRDERQFRLVQPKTEVADEAGTRRLRPIFERLDEAVPYDTIRLAASHLEVRT